MRPMFKWDRWRCDKCGHIRESWRKAKDNAWDFLAVTTDCDCIGESTWVAGEIIESEAMFVWGERPES